MAFKIQSDSIESKKRKKVMEPRRGVREGENGLLDSIRFNREQKKEKKRSWSPAAALDSIRKGENCL